MRQFMRTTLIGGLVFLVPLVVSFLLVAKAFNMTKVVAKPLTKFIPIDSVAGIAVAELMTAFILLLFCFIAGLFARSSWGRGLHAKVDSLLLNIFPGYAWIKGVTGEISDEDAASILKPVIVRFDDLAQLGFEVDRAAGGPVTVFVPDAPNPKSGTVVYVREDQVEPFEAGFRAVVTASKQLGRNTAEVFAKQRR